MLAAMTFASGVMAQQNDSNTPLHLLNPAYQYGYGMLKTENIKADLDRIYQFVEQNTPAKIVDGKPLSGAFRLTSYEWGVTYSAMLAAAEATGDVKYSD